MPATVLVALARKHQAELVTGDPEFSQVEGDVKILWLPHT